MSSPNLPPTGTSSTAGSRMADRLARPKVVLGAVITALAIWFIAVNNGTVRIHFWVVWVSAKLWIVLLCVFIAGALASWLLSRRRASVRRTKGRA
ncbi:LapA family protein [Actinospica durhamensis]|uniref:LapA family protein n=1 Tax=Actinospica durhamensis TaxID=1508375 RepID=A0A941EKW1_9ACTN|nr:LapA family protein [Actinospica durhamensis]MBR7834320.1 LapA family protein [Actinospica durhamensis]